MSVDTKWFAQQLAERGLSQRELARKIGLDQSAISLTFRGLRQMKFTEAADIARLLGLPVSEVLMHAGVPLNEGMQTVPVTGYLDGSGEVHCFPPDELERIIPPQPMPDGSAAIQCRTSGSPLQYMDGWTLFRNPPSAMPQLDVFSIMRLRNGIRTAGTVRRGYKAGRWNVSGPAFNAADVALEWVAPVMFIKII